MIKFMRSAVVVVACLFAGVGAWGAKVTVSPNPTYASELFGPGHDSPVYPDDMTPVVTLFFPANVEGVADNPDTDANEFVARVNHDGASIITFELLGAVFDGNVTGLMFDTNASETDTADAVAAPGSVASIMSGGRKGDSEIVIKVEEASTTITGARPISTTDPHTITFTMPRLAELALAGANAADANPANDETSVKLRATARVVSGEFTGHPVNGDRLTGGLANGYTEKVVLARDSLTLAISDSHSQAIVIDGDSAFTSIKTPPAAKGYVTLATVTVTTQQLNPATATMGSPRTVVGQVQATPGTDAETDAFVYKAEVTAVPASPWALHDLDGEEIDEGLRGTLTIHAAGTRGLFNEDDVLFVDYDNDGKMGEGESIAIDGMMAEGEALSIDPDKSDSFKDGITGNFKVLYMPGGKEHINHDSKIKVTALVEYSDPSAIDEGAKSNYTTLNFDGVGDPIMAYAIPHSTNGNGDKGNVRVRCEQAPAGSDEMCRVFLECWDDMGNRGFGEAPMVGQDMVMVWGGDDVEGVAEGLGEPESRISCRILSKGDVTVQQLTRDGHSRTLVNNTFVAD